MGKYGGKWLPPTPQEHECNRPWLTFAKVGQRWQCEADTGDGPCAKIWRVERDDSGKIWVSDQEGPADTDLRVFRPATDAEIDYRLNEELGVRSVRGETVDATVAALRKHFEIGIA